MGSFWTDNAPPQDFNLGGFSPAPAGASNDPRTMPQQPGSDFGMMLPPAIAKDPTKPGGFIDPGTGQPYQGGSLGQMGFTSGSIGNGGGTQGPMNTLGSFMSQSGPARQSGVARQMGQPGPISQQIAQNGFYAPPAISRPQQPGQQSGQVQMQSPDGQHMQYVNAEHVPHYQGLGAQVVNGSSYGQ